MVNESVPFWEIKYLNENLTTKMVIDYLLQLESEQEETPEKTRQERIEAAKAKLGEAYEACDKAVEVFENTLTYEPVAILGVTMDPSILVSISAVAGTAIWNILTSYLSTL